MRQLLMSLTENAVLIIDLIALVIILGGTIEAFVRGLRIAFVKPTGHERREVWLRYARWLVSGLTFQLAADIIETSIRNDWQSIGKMGAVAVIRTFLNYFLEKDLAEARERQHEAIAA
jgi:uncharacterized membrane protein